MNKYLTGSEKKDSPILAVIFSVIIAGLILGVAILFMLVF